MPTEASEKKQIEKLVNVARPVALLLALLAIREAPEAAAVRVATIFLGVYLFVAMAIVAAERVARFERIHFPPEIRSEERRGGEHCIYRWWADD